MGKRELVALLCLSSWCLEVVVWAWVCLQFMFVAFPDHTDLLFLLIASILPFLLSENVVIFIWCVPLRLGQ